MTEKSFGQKIKEVILHPISFLLGLFSLLNYIFGTFEPLFNFLGATWGTWYPILTISASELLPRLDFVPKGTGDKVLIFGSILVVLVLIDKFGEKIWNKIFQTKEKAKKKMKEGMEKGKKK